MPVTEETYERLALEDLEGQWELVCGRPRQKPGMTQEHNFIGRKLARRIGSFLDYSQFDVSANSARLRIANGTTFIPDVAVVQIAQMPGLRGTGRLETYLDPVPFVAEVWSPSTGGYDVDTKFPEYKLRKDSEIWRIHPYDESLIAWRLRSDGMYSEHPYRDGIVPIESLPGVTIDLAELFRFP
ncbi:MAG: Uma2 family endonuclease [Dehalococcoidia bacterium]